MIPWWAYAIASTIFATAFAIVRKKGLQLEHALDFSSARALSVVFLSLFLIPFVNFKLITKDILILVFLVSVLGSLGILFMSKSFRHSQISHLYPLINLKSVFVLILAALFLSEQVGIKHLIGIIILLIGAYALEADHHFSNLIAPLKSLIKSKYSLFFIFAVFVFSITALMDKYIVTNLLDPITFFFLVWIFVAFNLNMIHGYLYGFKEIKSCFVNTKFLPLLCGFFSLSANLLALKALSLAYVSLVTPVLMLSSLFVVLVGGKFFKESHIGYRVIVSIAMLLGVYLIIT